MNITRQKYIEFTSVEEALTHQPAYDIVQLKYDGIWCMLGVPTPMENIPDGQIVHQCAGILGALDGKSTWTSRTGEVKHREFTNLPPGVYLGEFMYGSHWAQDPSRNGKTYLFDIIWDGRNDLTRSSYARRYSELVRRCPVDRDAQIQAVSNVHISLASAFWTRVLATRSEGLVFRRSQAGYDDILGRLKRKVEIDYVVFDIVEGKGKHVGRLGALVLGLYIKGVLTPCGKVGGGFSDGDRNDIWYSWPRDRGKVITVDSRGQFPSGKARHPNFVRFRDDKSPEECTWEILTTTEE